MCTEYSEITTPSKEYIALSVYLNIVVISHWIFKAISIRDSRFVQVTSIVYLRIQQQQNQRSARSICIILSALQSFRLHRPFPLCTAVHLLDGKAALALVYCDVIYHSMIFIMLLSNNAIWAYCPVVAHFRAHMVLKRLYF